MAPPRQQRTATVADDSRSEASSGTREPKTTTSKGRKGANGTNPSLRADGRASAAVNAATANVTSIPTQQQPPEESPNVSTTFFVFGANRSLNLRQDAHFVIRELMSADPLVRHAPRHPPLLPPRLQPPHSQCLLQNLLAHPPLARNWPPITNLNSRPTLSDSRAAPTPATIAPPATLFLFFLGYGQWHHPPQPQLPKA